MKMALDDSGGLNIVRSYEPGRVGIRDQSFDQSLIILPNRLIDDWTAVSADQLRGSDFKPLLDAPPEVLILGTGEQQVFPDPAVFMTLMDMGIGFEVMDNSAACRTYNILIGEGRNAALALIMPSK